MDKGTHTLSLILTATVSMAVGAGLMYYKNRKEIGFMKKYPQYLTVEEFMKESEIGLPTDVTDADQIKSYLTLYNDPYADYKDGATNEEEKITSEINRSPTALGSGFEIAFNEDGQLFIKDVLEGMPAYDQGLKEGDVILSIDDTIIEEFADAKAIKGKEGTTARLIVLRGGSQQEIVMTRYSDSDAAAGVRSRMVDDTLIVEYLDVGQFSAAPFEEAVLENDYNSLIVDLRNNPGGEISVAVQVADHFIDHAEVKLNHYNGSSSNYTTEDGIDIDVPIVLIVNDMTASAAEIFTALLKQNADVTIVGVNTYGKGVFQNRGMINGGDISYTAGTFTVGDWPCWQGVGIAPDIEVKMDPDLIGTDDDIQLQKALEILG